MALLKRLAGATHWARTLVMALTPSVVACGGGDDDNDRAPRADEYTAELFPSTRVLDADALKAISADEPDGTLRFTGTPKALETLAPYDVMIGEGSERVPEGLLRIVTAIEKDGGNLVLRTRQAPLQLAFRKLHVRFARHVADIGERTIAWDQPTRRTQQIQGSEWPQKDILIEAVNGDEDLSTWDDQAIFTGKLGGGFDYVFGVDVDWGDVLNVPQKVKDCVVTAFTDCSLDSLIPEAKVGFEVKSGMFAHLDGKGVTFLPYGRDYLFDTVKLDAVKLGILWFYPEVDVVARVEGQASSQFDFSFGAEAGFEAGLTYSNKSGPKAVPPKGTWEFDAPNVDATLQASAKVSVGPELHIRLYKIAGPYAGLKVFAELDANQEKSPCYELRAGVTGNFGFDVQVDLPAFSPFTLANWSSDDFVLYDQVVKSGDCKPLPGGTGSDAAGDPAPQDFANPSFVPWSNSYTGLVYAHPFGNPGSELEFSHLTPTIDGRFMLSGSGMNALAKVDGDGSVIWAKRYLGPTPVYETGKKELLPSAVVNTPDVAMLVAAHPMSLLKLEPNGEVIWARQLPVVSHQFNKRFTAMVADGSGGYYLAGNHGEEIFDHQAVDAGVMRLDAAGNIVWARRFGDAANGEVARVLVALDDGVVVAGHLWDPATSHSYAWAARLDGSGAVVWAKRLDVRACGSSYESSTYVTTGLRARDGDIVLAGTANESGYNTLIFKLKPDGTLAWSSTETDILTVDIGYVVTSLIELPTSGYLAAGTWTEHNQGDSHDDLWLGSLDGLGRFQWLKRFGSRRTEGNLVYESDSYPSLKLMQDGGVLMAAFSEPLAAEGGSMWLSKVFAKNGEITFAAPPDPSTTLRYGDAPWQAANLCVIANAWSPPIAPHNVAFAPLAVSVEPVTPSVTRYAP